MKIKNLAPVILGVLLLANILAWLTVYELSQPQILKVSFFDIGQGDSIFIQTPLGYQVLIDGGPDSTVLKNYPNPLEYNSKHVCKIIEVAQKKAVFETILIDTGAYCDFNAIVYFNNLGNNQYKGLNFEHYFPGIVTKVCDFLPRYVMERNGGDIGNWNELESKLYSEYYSQTKNLMVINKNIPKTDTLF